MVLNYNHIYKYIYLKLIYKGSFYILVQKYVLKKGLHCGL